MREPITRHDFLRETAALTAGLAIASRISVLASDEETEFQSQWAKAPERVCLGPEYCADPLQDWRVSHGRIECVKATPDQNVRLLTRQLGEAPGGDLRMSIRIGRVGGQPLATGDGSAGFRIGIQGPLRDYRNSLESGWGLDVGVTSRGELFIGQPGEAEQTPSALGEQTELELRLVAEPADGGYKVSLSAHDIATGRVLGEISQDLLSSGRFVGNIALVANFTAAGRNPRNNDAKQAIDGVGEFWFADWKVAGTKVVARE